MSLFAIADLHLSFGTDKPMSVFRGWDNYEERLKENWNRVVQPSDTVVIIGDISWGMTLHQAYADFAFIEALNGKKIIVRGNHDYWFSTKTSIDRYLTECGFASISILFNNSYDYGEYAICGTRGWVNVNSNAPEAQDQKILAREAGRLRLSLEDGKKSGKKPLVFLHYPPIYASNECLEILDVMTEYKIDTCYYGHIHGMSANYAINGHRDGVLYQLVACDYVQFEPVKVME